MQKQEQFRDSYILSKISNLIEIKFPKMILDVKSEDNITIFFCSNKKKYYSNKFQALLLDINLNILWPEGIDNVIFVYDATVEQKKYYPAKIQQNSVFVVNKWEVQKTKGLSVKEAQVFEQDDSFLSLEAA